MNSVASTDRESAYASNSFVVSGSQALAAAIFGSAFAYYGYPGAIRVIAGIAIFAAILFSLVEKAKGGLDRIICSSRIMGGQRKPGYAWSA